MTIERPDLRKDNHDLLRKVQVVWQEIEQGIMMPKVKVVSCQLSSDSFLPHPWPGFSLNQRTSPFDALFQMYWWTWMRGENGSRKIRIRWWMDIKFDQRRRRCQLSYRVKADKQEKPTTTHTLRTQVKHLEKEVQDRDEKLGGMLQILHTILQRSEDQDQDELSKLFLADYDTSRADTVRWDD